MTVSSPRGHRNAIGGRRGGGDTGDVLVERLLQVIDEGRRTATFKLALLAGLIDAVAMLPGETAIPTRMIAERVLALYYPQIRPFVAQRRSRPRPETDLDEVVTGAESGASIAARR